VIDRLARRLLMVLLFRIRVGTLEIVEDSQRWRLGHGAPVATVEVVEPSAWRALLRGSRGMADAYAEQRLNSPDLVTLIRLGALNASGLDRLRNVMAPVHVPLRLIGALARRSTRRRRRRDIAAHYDIGNRLFSLMLDPTMSYSCAVFEHERMTLEQAQLAKLEHVCAKLDLRPGQHVLEIGTGWGGFAVHAAATRGCHVTTTTISREQYDYATALIRRARLEHLVTVVMEDYRDLEGRYDRLVSIEMIEAVGWRHFGTFLEKCSSLLTESGMMLLQAITIDDRAYEAEKASRSFMNTRIFPGGALPSLAVIVRALARRTDMQAVDLEDLTAHYVQTLRCWRTRFEAAHQQLDEQGYDQQFRRLWRLYLAYCEAGFAERRICDVQLLLAKPCARPAPLKRTALSQPGPAPRRSMTTTAHAQRGSRERVRADG